MRTTSYPFFRDNNLSSALLSKKRIPISCFNDSIFEDFFFTDQHESKRYNLENSFLKG